MSEDAGESARDGRVKRVDWSDPNIPAGDSPPLPVWPLALSAALWSLWLGFLVVTGLRG